MWFIAPLAFGVSIKGTASRKFRSIKQPKRHLAQQCPSQPQVILLDYSPIFCMCLLYHVYKKLALSSKATS